MLGLGGALDGVDRVGVLLVDGLGRVSAAGGLRVRTDPDRSRGRAAGSLTAGFPSTTPVSLVTAGHRARRRARTGCSGSPRGGRTGGCSTTSTGATTRTRASGSRCRPGSSGPRRPGCGHGGDQARVRGHRADRRGQPGRGVTSGRPTGRRGRGGMLGGAGAAPGRRSSTATTPTSTSYGHEDGVDSPRVAGGGGRGRRAARPARARAAAAVGAAGDRRSRAAQRAGGRPVRPGRQSRLVGRGGRGGGRAPGALPLRGRRAPGTT